MMDYYYDYSKSFGEKCNNKKKNGLALLNEKKPLVFISKNYDVHKSFKPIDFKFRNKNYRAKRMTKKAIQVPVMAAVGLVGTFLSESTKSEQVNSNELVFELDFTNQKNIEQYVEFIDNIIKSSILEACTENNLNMKNIITNSIEDYYGSSNKILIENDQNISFLDYSKLTENVSTDITTAITRKIVNDIRNSFENKTVDSLMQKVTEANNKSAFGILSKIFDPNEKSSKIKNAQSSKDRIQDNINVIFNELSKSIQELSTGIKFHEQFRTDLINESRNNLKNIKGDKNTIIFKNTQGINILLKKITDLQVAEKFFTKINQLDNFQVKNSTLNSLARKVDQSNFQANKEERLTDVFSGFFTPLIFAGGAALLAGGLYFASGKKENSASFYHFNNKNNNLIVNLSKDLPNSFFYDDIESSNAKLSEIVAERRSLIAENKIFKTQKLSNLLEFFDSNKIDYSNPNAVLLRSSDMKIFSNFLKAQTAKGVRFNEFVDIIEPEPLSNSKVLSTAKGEFPQTTLVDDLLFNL